MPSAHEVERLVALTIQARVPVLLWGEPGVGKTSAVSAVADALGSHLEVVILSLREPTDIAGLPCKTERGVELLAPHFVLAAQAAAERGQSSVVVFDELTTCRPDQQAAALRIIQEGVVGDQRLPEGTAIVAIANPPGSAADGWDLAAPAANRFCHVEWTLSAGDFATGMITGWATGPGSLPVLPPTWTELVPLWQARVGSFINARPALLHAMPESVDARGKAWPSPRTWDLAARLSAAAQAADAPDLELTLVTGCVGEGAALEFAEWLAAGDLPDPEDLLAHPSAFRVPRRGDIVFSVLGSVVAAVRSVPSEQRWNNAWQLLDAVVLAGQVDLAAEAAKLLIATRETRWPLPASVDAFLPVLHAAGLFS